MVDFPITLMFQDGETTRIGCRSFETVVQSAARQGLRLLTDCREGGCGTCKAVIHSGQYSLDDYSQEALPDAELQQGRILTCRLRPESRGGPIRWRRCRCCRESCDPLRDTHTTRQPELHSAARGNVPTNRLPSSAQKRRASRRHRSAMKGC